MAILPGHQPPTPLLKDFALLSLLLLLLLLYIYSFLSCQTLHNVSKTKSRQLIGLGNKNKNKNRRLKCVWGRDSVLRDSELNRTGNSQRRKERAHTHTQSPTKHRGVINRDTLSPLVFLLLFAAAVSLCPFFLLLLLDLSAIDTFKLILDETELRDWERLTKEIEIDDVSFFN